MMIEIDIIKKCRRQIKYSSDLHRLLCETYGDDEQENFIVVPLDAAHFPIKVILASRGTVNRCLVHPREIFKEAIRLNSAAIIIAHNHPSGVPSPSKEDDEVTKMLMDAGKIVGIEVVEHLVFSRHNYYSYAVNKFDRLMEV